MIFWLMKMGLKCLSKKLAKIVFRTCRITKRDSEWQTIWQ